MPDSLSSFNNTYDGAHHTDTDDHVSHTYEMTPGFKPFTNSKCLCAWIKFSHRTEKRQSHDDVGDDHIREKTALQNNDRTNYMRRTTYL